MKHIITITAALLLVGAGCPSDTQMENMKEVGMAVEQENTFPAPDFSLKNYDGDTVSLRDFAGMPLVINSWAAWCPFCTKELPDFAAVQQEFAGDVVFIAIDRAESLSVAKGYTDDLGVTDDMIFLLDPRDSFYKSIGGFSMPETIFVNQEGNVVFHKRGPMSREEARKRVEDLIAHNN